jgi:hypothetical protein
MMFDNVKIISLVAEEEVIFSQTQIVPFLNVSDCVDLTFTWPDAGVGQYVFTYEIITPDSNADNNICIQPYNIINTIECVEDWECVDYTGPGAGHWVEESCCGGYFWPGDATTTMYGNNWNDALYLKNATGGLNFNLLGGAVTVDFDTWFQISAGDFGYVQYSIDGGMTLVVSLIHGYERRRSFRMVPSDISGTWPGNSNHAIPVCLHEQCHRRQQRMVCGQHPSNQRSNCRLRT